MIRETARHLMNWRSTAQAVRGGMTALLLLACADTLFAHDLWILPRSSHPTSGQPVDVAVAVSMQFPHPGDAAAGDKPVPEARVAQWTAFSRGWEQHRQLVRLSDLRAEGTELVGSFVPTAGDWVVLLETHPKDILIAAEEFNDYLLHDGLPQVLEWRRDAGELHRPGRERYTRYAKTLLRATGATEPVPASIAAIETVSPFLRPVGARLEFVPLADPLSRRAGDELPVLLLLDGQPLAHRLVSSVVQGLPPETFQQTLRTDADGRASFRLDRPGLWMLRTIHMTRAPAADAATTAAPAESRADSAAATEPADWQSLWASLTFEVLPAEQR
ncbi:MAG: DUF4198 domain-containing protein [Planctomycetota bacterium]